MAALETIQLEHVPSTHSVHVALYRDVQNAEFLQQQLLARNQEFEYAFIDASCVSSFFSSIFTISPLQPSMSCGLGNDSIMATRRWEKCAHIQLTLIHRRSYPDYRSSRPCTRPS